MPPQLRRSFPRHRRRLRQRNLLGPPQRFRRSHLAFRCSRAAQAPRLSLPSVPQWRQALPASLPLAPCSPQQGGQPRLPPALRGDCHWGAHPLRPYGVWARSLGPRAACQRREHQRAHVPARSVCSPAFNGSGTHSARVFGPGCWRGRLRRQLRLDECCMCKGARAAHAAQHAVESA